MNNCKCKRIVGPFGSWTYEQILGAHVRVSSISVSNMARSFDADQTCTIKDIYFRVSNDGKTITVIELNEFPGMFFGWKDLEILGIVVKNDDNNG